MGTAAEHAVTIPKAFRKRTRPRDLVNEKQAALKVKTTPAPLPANTSFGSRFITVRWIVKKQMPLQAAVGDPQWNTENADVKECVLSTNVRQERRMFSSLLQPLWKIMCRANTDDVQYLAWVYKDVLTSKNTYRSYMIKKSSDSGSSAMWNGMHAWNINQPHCSSRSDRIFYSISKMDVCFLLRDLSASASCTLFLRSAFASLAACRDFFRSFLSLLCKEISWKTVSGTDGQATQFLLAPDKCSFALAGAIRHFRILSQ